MPQYTPQPKIAATPSRKLRKGGRSSSFIENKMAARLQRKARKVAREAREARLAAQQEELEVTE